MLLERVQRKAARFCLQNYNRTASITDMLRELEWDTLEMTRKKNRLTLTYKLSRSLVDIIKSNSMQISTKVRQGSKSKNRSSFAY